MAKRSVNWNEWRAHWTLVLACAFGFSFSAIMTYSFGLFLVPISEEFGWSRAATSIGITLNGVVSVLLSPLAGWIVARWGVRRVALPGLGLLAISIAVFAAANGSPTQWFMLWLIYAVVDLSVKSTVWTTAVAYAFRDERSLAMAFTLTGVSIALVIAPPLTAALITELGWRSAFVALGLGWGGVALAVALPFLKDVGFAGGSPSADTAPVGESDATRSDLRDRQGLTLWEALRSGPLQLIACSTFLTMLLGIAVQVHQVPILTGGGMSLQHAAYLVSLGGAAGIAGKLLTGWLMDRFEAATVGALTLMLSSAAFVLLIDAVRTDGRALLAMVVIGYASAAKMQICALLTSRYAGMLNFAVIFGFMSSMLSLGAGAGPLLAGMVYDHFGTYDPMLAVASGGTALASIMVFALRRHPVRV